MGGERGIERDGALRGQCCSGAIMDGDWSHQADAAVAVFMVVPVEEPLAVSAGVFDRAEAIREVGPVLEGFGAPCKGAISQWGSDPPGNCRSSR